MTFGNAKARCQDGGSLSGEEDDYLRESIQYRSDIQVEDHSIIDESMVVITLLGEIAQIIKQV